MHENPLAIDSAAGMDLPQSECPDKYHEFVGQPRTAGPDPESFKAVSTNARLLLELPGGGLKLGFGPLITDQPRRKLDDRTSGRDSVLFDQDQFRGLGHRDDADHISGRSATDVLPTVLFDETEMRAGMEGSGVLGLLVVGHRQAFHQEWDRAHRSGTVAVAMTERPANSGMKSPSTTVGSEPFTHGTTTRLIPFGTTIFTTISQRAAASNAINLGQGFPDEDPPEALIEASIASLRAGHNQYAPMTGLPELRQAIANDQARRGRGIWCPDDEVTVTSGATGALAAALLGTLEHGDEVILFDPAYDAYPALVAMAGAQARRLTPAAPDFKITRALIDSAITSRTRMIVLNSPWNPTGRVLDDEELADIADCCIENDLICVSDEVYERLVFTRAHRSIASMPGMRDRTIVISSMGKTYSCTGWKVGWACATGTLTSAIRAAHQFLVFSVPSPLQKAATRALNDFGQDWDRSLIASYGSRRDLLLEGLAAAGLDPIAPEGTYFILANITGHGDVDDHAFCDRLLETVGVAALPTSVFTEGGLGMRSMVRFAFCKPEAVLQEALTRLDRLTPLTRGDV
jgi:N-succinyldiaminopimelate aminotransferase